MIPSVGATCLFNFTSRFNALNGVYRIRGEVTFRDSIVSGVNYVSNLYTPAGLSEEDFIGDYPSYAKDRVTILESVIDHTVVYYTPESIFQTVPDPTIREYMPLVLVVDLGVQKNPQVILPIMDEVEDLIKSSIGSSHPLRVVTNPDNKVYLTDTQYSVLQAARAANIETLVPLRVQLATALAANVELAAKITYYEAKLVAAAST